MADPVKTPVKKIVTGSGAQNAEAQAAFNTNMAAAITAAQAAAVYSAQPAGAQQPIIMANGLQVTTDPVTGFYDGTNYNFVSAVNYIITV